MVQETDPLGLDSPAGEHRAASIGEDQAAGLRDMFGVSRQPKAVVLACALDADTAVPLGTGTANALRLKGLKTLLIDCIPLSQRRETLKPVYPARYDLAQVLKNEVPLEKAIKAVGTNLWFGIGMRMRQEGARKKLKTPELSQRLADANYDLDLMLIVSNVAESRAFPFFSPSLDVVIIASPREERLVAAMDFIKTLSVTSNGRPIPVIIVGGADEAEGQQAFDRLSEAAQKLLAQPLESLGWVSATPQSINQDDGWESQSLVLPTTVYQKIADRLGQ